MLPAQSTATLLHQAGGIDSTGSAVCSFATGSQTLKSCMVVEFTADQTAEEDPAMPGVDGVPVVESAARGQAEGGGGGESGTHVNVVEEAEHGRRAVELAEPALEPGVGDETAPPLADKGRARARDAGSSGGSRKRISSTSSSIQHRHWHGRRHAALCC